MVSHNASTFNDKKELAFVLQSNDMVRRALHLLHQPGSVVELRALNVNGRGNRADSGYFDDHELLVQAAAHLSGRAEGVYITLNGINPALLARAANSVTDWAKTTTSDKDVVRRNWFPLDLDPIRPSGISSTNEELERANERADQLVAWLRGQGWPDPIEAMSGNGAHRLYRIDLPNDDESRRLIDLCLAVLALHFDDEQVKVDTTVGNAARIWKLYGTLAAKGSDTPERPHRLATLTSVPDEVGVVTVEQLRLLAAMLPEEPAPPHRKGGSDFDLGRWIEEHSDRIKVARQGAWLGGRKWVLDECPWNPDHRDKSAYIVQFKSGAVAAGCHHNGCQGNDWRRLRELVEGPRTVGSAPSSKQKAKGDAAESQDSLSKSERLIGALERLGLNLRLNVLEDEVEINGRRMDDIMLSEINLRLIDLGFSRADVADAVNVVAGRNRYHPVKDYLDSLQWDGKDHLSTLLKHLDVDGPELDYGGTMIKLGHVLITKWLIGCVARALDGDNPDAFKPQTPMLVLIGPQGIGKSSVVRFLASGIGPAYHRESPLDPHNPEDKRSLVTEWIWEVTELGGSLRRADRDAIKSIITQEWHTYRKPYGKYLITKPMLCNLVGTLNPETGFLDDPTGHRRFWPVVLKGIDHAYAKAVDVNQLWAQVVHLYRNEGMRPVLKPAEVQALGATHEEHEVENPLETYVRMHFNVEPGNDGLRCPTAVIIQVLKESRVSLPDDLRSAGRALNDVLTPMGLRRGKFKHDGESVWGWFGIAPKKPGVLGPATPHAQVPSLMELLEP